MTSQPRTRRARLLGEWRKEIYYLNSGPLPADQIEDDDRAEILAEYTDEVYPTADTEGEIPWVDLIDTGRDIIEQYPGASLPKLAYHLAQALDIDTRDGDDPDAIQ